MTIEYQMIRKSVTLFFLCFSLTAVLAENTYYVKEGGGNSMPRDGAGWSTAFVTLQEALEIAGENDRIYMASGTYYPSSYTGIVESEESEGNYALTERDYTFLINKTIHIYGGFNKDGSENSPEERNPLNSPTFLSGDRDGDGRANLGDLYHVVVIVGGENPIQPVLDGLTITCGYSDNYIIETYKSKVNGVDIYPVYGAGIHNNKNAQTRFNNVTLTGNKASRLGGGMYIQDSSPILTDVLIEVNSAGSGAGIAFLNSSSILTDVILKENVADIGGGIYMNESDPKLTAVIVEGNAAKLLPGGGLYIEYSKPELTNVLVKGNKAALFGSGIHNLGSSPVLTNVTITGNKTEMMYASGLHNDMGSSPSIRNSIIWGNDGTNISNAVPSIDVPGYFHSLVGGSGGSGNWDSSYGQDGGGNIDMVPLFVKPIELSSPSWPDDGDLHLQSGSPAVNAGSAVYYQSSRVPDISTITTDLDGNPLWYEINGVKQIDMGAYQTVKIDHPAPPVPPVPLVFAITIPDIEGITTTREQDVMR